MLLLCTLTVKQWYACLGGAQGSLFAAEKGTLDQAQPDLKCPFHLNWAL